MKLDLHFIRLILSSRGRAKSSIGTGRQAGVSEFHFEYLENQGALAKHVQYLGVIEVNYYSNTELGTLIENLADKNEKKWFETVKALGPDLDENFPLTDLLSQLQA